MSTNMAPTNQAMAQTMTPPAPVSSPRSDVRLLFVVDSWFPGVGGAELQSLKLAHALKRQGAQIRFVAPHLDKSMPVTEQIEGFDVQKVTFPQIRVLGSLILYIKLALLLYRRRHSYDCIHFHVTGSMAVIGGLLRQVIGKPMIAKVSGFFEFEHGVLKRSRGFNPRLAASRWALRHIDYFQTISTQTRERLLEAGFDEHSIRYIPNGIELSDNPASRHSDGIFRAGYCGRMRAIKGVDVLIRAFDQVLKVQPGLDMQLLIAGDGETEQELHQLVSDLGIGDKIEFLGEIRDVEGFLGKLDLYVQPSYAEGLPNSVIEAMNAGLPIVATDVGGNNDLVESGTNGYLFEAGDTDALAVLLINCYQNQDDLQAFSKASKQKISRFGFEQVTAQLQELYNNDNKQDQ